MGRKKKVVAKAVGQDVFEFVAGIAGRDLTEDENKILVESCRVFICDNFTPLQVFEEDALKEEVIVHGLVRENDDDDDDIEDDSPWDRRKRDDNYGSLEDENND